MDALKSIVKEGLEQTSVDEKSKCLLYMESAPENSIMYKVWKMFEQVNLDPVMSETVPVFSGQWETCIRKLTTEGGKEEIVEEIPAEDAEFWREIYKTRKHLTYGKQFIIN
jgi:hypothetical protein